VGSMGRMFPIQVLHGVARAHADAMRIPVLEVADVAEDVVVCSRTIQRAPTDERPPGEVRIGSQLSMELRWDRVLGDDPRYLVDQTRLSGTVRTRCRRLQDCILTSAQRPGERSGPRGPFPSRWMERRARRGLWTSCTQVHHTPQRSAESLRKLAVRIHSTLGPATVPSQSRGHPVHDTSLALTPTSQLLLICSQFAFYQNDHPATVHSR
jgi:hypothetical protein